ncbi:MAG TPA: hypothetical protein VFB38_12735 [Chthonomonadaceae bacterium]|nr:hypothetical protein [Chthonomonadaceae bacterium]
MPLLTMRERRRRATRRFVLRVCLLLLLMGAVTYSAWFAPWAKPVHNVEIERVR